MDNVAGATYGASTSIGICNTSSQYIGADCNPSLEFFQNNCGNCSSADPCCEGVVGWNPSPYLDINRMFSAGMAIVIRVQDAGLIRWGIE